MLDPSSLILASVLEPSSLIEGASVLTALIIIGGIVFAESGLLIGFFLPGDTLLFTAGFFAAQGHLPLAWVLIVIFAAAVIGDNVGYTIGKKMGPRLFKKQDGILFRQEYVARAEAFYEKHGGKTIILARFIPVVRTFAPVVAGVGNMPRKRFAFFNLIGGLIWTVGVVMLGFWLGSLIDPGTMERFLLLAIVGVMVLTFGPAVFHIAKDERARRLIAERLRSFFKGGKNRAGSDK
jgi:membrane-associated protein